MNKPLSEHPKLLLDPYRRLDREGRRAGHRGFRRRSPRNARPRLGRASASRAASSTSRAAATSSRSSCSTSSPARRPRRRSTSSRRSSTCSPATAAPRSRSSDGRKHSFEWGPKSLFALPLNARYQHFNASGQRARAARLHQQSLHDAQPVPQRGVRLRQPVRVPRAAGLAEVFQRRRRFHPGAARAATCGRRISFPTSPRSS